ncbi:MAG: carotenoid oxygenase family protein [bacterium]|nr:carotenoid oxygenase family protein [bacterium]
MSMPAPPYENQFRANLETQLQTGVYDALKVEGTIPDWLTGTLLRNGPGQFEVAHASYPHWFDGQCMMYRYTFQNGRVSFANAFLQSQSYLQDNANGEINFTGVATPTPKGIWPRIVGLFHPKPTDNCNINFDKQAGEYLALTELPASYVIEPFSLDTLELFQYDDTINVDMETAHPHYRDDGTIINYMLKMGLRSTYEIYHVAGRTRTKLASLPRWSPAYMHSFGYTGRYVVLTENPMRLPPITGILDVAFQINPFIFNFKWDGTQPTTFTVVDLQTGQVVTQADSDPIYTFHHINSYVEGDEIVHDLAAYRNNDVWKALYLDVLRSDHFMQTPSYIYRYRIPLNQGKHTTIKPEQIGTVQFELPRINYPAYNAKPYQYAYGVGVQSEQHPDFPNQIAKVDVTSGDAKTWYVEGNYPSESYFVANPAGTAEDDGVVLSTVYNSHTDDSFLLVLDAASFTEIARAPLPYRIPFGFHGMFYPGLVERTAWSPPVLRNARRKS